MKRSYLKKSSEMEEEIIVGKEWSAEIVAISRKAATVWVKTHRERKVEMKKERTDL